MGGPQMRQPAFLQLCCSRPFDRSQNRAQPRSASILDRVRRRPIKSANRWNREVFEAGAQALLDIGAHRLRLGLDPLQPAYGVEPSMPGAGKPRPGIAADSSGLPPANE